MKLWIDSAARFPSLMASITVAGPETTSPPAKTPVRLVSIVRGLIQMVPSSLRVISFGRKLVSGVSPMAKMTVSASCLNSDPSIGVVLSSRVVWFA